MSKRASGHHTGAYARYIRQVVVNRKILKIGTDTYVVSFINTLQHSVLYMGRRELDTLKVKISHLVMG